MDINKTKLIREWGSSDQNIMNQAIHNDAGKPKKMPSPFDSKLRSAAEDAVDFYWDDWEEYQTDRDGLIDNAVRGYLRRYFPKDFEMMVRMFENKINEGQFSWMTHDTGDQIGSERQNRITVFMYDNQGNKWKESKYDGYGEFGGKDYYELLDQMNGGEGDRQAGIDLAFNDKKVKAGEVLFPALVTTPNYNWKRHDFKQEAENDPNQSWYQEDYDDDDEYYESVQERHITVKRKYTENYPAVKVGKAARIRNKVLEAIKDGKLTKEEFDTILKEMTVDSTRWIRRNANYFNVSEDGITLSKTGKRILNELAPATDINEKATPFKIANARAEEIFGEFGIATLDYSQIARVIDVKLADKLAKKYGEDSFMALSELDMEELLNKNPKLVKENKTNNNMKTNFVFESFGDFVNSLNITNESTELVTEAFKSSMLASLFRTKGAKMDATLAKAFYGTAKIKMDLVEDEDILVVNPETAYKNKQADSIIFYVSDVPKENPYAPRDAWYDHKTIPGEGYLLAVASGENAFYTKSWGKYDRQYKLTKGSETDSIGISKKYKGWDGTGLYNVKRIAEMADRAIVLNMTLLRQKYSSVEQRNQRDAAKKGAIAFKSDKDFKKENMDRYHQILADKAASLPLDAIVKEAIEKLANQIKDGLAAGKVGRYNDIIIGTKKNGSEAKMRDASNHMSNILDDYTRYVSYVTQAEESKERYGETESYYERESKNYAKAITDRVAQIDGFDYVW